MTKKSPSTKPVADAELLRLGADLRLAIAAENRAMIDGRKLADAVAQDALVAAAVEHSARIVDRIAALPSRSLSLESLRVKALAVAWGVGDQWSNDPSLDDAALRSLIVDLLGDTRLYAAHDRSSAAVGPALHQ